MRLSDQLEEARVSPAASAMIRGFKSDDWRGSVRSKVINGVEVVGHRTSGVGREGGKHNGWAIYLVADPKRAERSVGISFDAAAENLVRNAKYFGWV